MGFLDLRSIAEINSCRIALPNCQATVGGGPFHASLFSYLLSPLFAVSVQYSR